MPNDNIPRFRRGNSTEEQVIPITTPEIRRRKPTIDVTPERTIIIGMTLSNDFLEKVLPLIKYLRVGYAQTVAQWCKEYFEQYHRAPERSIEGIYEEKKKELPEDEAKLVGEFLSSLNEEYGRNEDFKFDADYNLDKARDYFGQTAKIELEQNIHQSGTKDQIREVIDKYYSDSAKINAQSQGPEQFTAKKVMEMIIPEPKWAIPNLLLEGLSILGGKPKKGKSLFALNTLLVITCGIPALGNIAVKRGSGIYLALEDTKGGIQRRIRTMLKGKPASDSLHFFLQGSFPHMPEGLSLLEAEIQKYSDLRLVVIDTWGRFKPLKKGQRINLYDYDVDVEDTSKVKELADKYGIAILILHHMRKTGSDDIVDAFLGGVGLTGTADGLLALVRKGQDPEAVLHIEGRDVEPQRMALKLDAASLTWESMGDAGRLQSTTNRQAIFDAILNSGGPMEPKDIAPVTGLKLDYLHTTMQQMRNQGRLIKTERGKYDVSVDAKMRAEMNKNKVVRFRRGGNGGADL